MTSIKTSILYLGFLLIVFFFIMYFCLEPMISGIKTNKEIILKKQQEFVDQEEKNSLLRILQKDQEGLQLKINKTNDLWPDDKEVSRFIVDLEGLANEENVNLRNISISEPNSSSSKEKKKSMIQFSFDLQAPFDKNLTFIRNLEKFSRFNTINQIDFSKNEEDLVSMKVIGVAYYGE